MAMDKGEKRKDVSTRVPTLAPAIMVVGPECPRQSQEEEDGGERPRIVRAPTCGRSGEQPSTQNLENSAVGSVRPCETEEMEDSNEES